MNIGLSDEVSELYFSTDESDMNHIVNSDYPNAMKVNVSTMDTICKDKDISLIKMDVEGYEKYVLKGAKQK